jgi:hypothetical protein
MAQKIYTKIVTGISLADLNTKMNAFFNNAPQQVIKIAKISNLSFMIYCYDPYVYNEIASYFGALPSGFFTYGGANIVGNNIYGIPLTYDKILKLDTSTDTLSTINCLPGYLKWGQSFVNGNFIYGLPYERSDFLKIDTTADTYTTLGDTGTGSEKYISSCVVGTNVYIFPGLKTNILKFDLTTDTFVSIGNIGIGFPTTIGYLKFSSTAKLMPNGFIYAIPMSYDKIVKLDPTTDTWTEIGSLGYALYKWYCFESVGNIIYGIPYQDTRILVIDTTTDTISYINTGLISKVENYGACAKIGNVIYGIPYDEIRIMRFDTLTGSISFFSEISTLHNYYNATISPAGNIYSLPEYNDKVLKIVP